MTLKTKKVLLRALQKSDLNKEYVKWLNDRDVSKYLISTVFPSNMEQLVDFYKNISVSKNDVMFAIIRQDTKKHIGNIKLGNINWVHRHGYMGILIGDKNSWGKGFAQEATGLLLNYAFNQLNLNKVLLDVYANHAAAIKAYANVGFKEEGRLKNMLFSNGKFEDQIIMAITKDEYRK